MQLVSVVIPVYNTGEYFCPCIESVINQSYPNLEIILVDDCSTDQITLDLLKEYSAKDQRIKLLRNEVNQGLSYTRNRGVDHATGTYLAFLDSDDLFSPDCIERLVQALETNQTEIAFGQTEAYSPNVDREHFLKRDAFRHAMPACDYCDMQEFIAQGHLFDVGWIVGNVMRLDVFRQEQMFCRPDLRIWEDNEWRFRCIPKFKSFSVIDFIGFYHLIRENSLSTHHNLSSVKKQMLSAELVYQNLKNHGLFPQYWAEYLSLVLSNLTWHLRETRDLQSIPEMLQFALEMLRRNGFFLMEKKFQPEGDLILSFVHKSDGYDKKCDLFIKKRYAKVFALWRVD